MSETAEQLETFQSMNADELTEAEFLDALENLWRSLPDFLIAVGIGVENSFANPVEKSWSESDEWRAFIAGRMAFASANISLRDTLLTILEGSESFSPTAAWQDVQHVKNNIHAAISIIGGGRDLTDSAHGDSSEFSYVIKRSLNIVKGLSDEIIQLTSSADLYLKIHVSDEVKQLRAEIEAERLSAQKRISELNKEAMKWRTRAKESRGPLTSKTT